MSSVRCLAPYAAVNSLAAFSLYMQPQACARGCHRLLSAFAWCRENARQCYSRYSGLPRRYSRGNHAAHRPRWGGQNDDLNHQLWRNAQQLADVVPGGSGRRESACWCTEHLALETSRIELIYCTPWLRVGEKQREGGSPRWGCCETGQIFR